MSFKAVISERIRKVDYRSYTHKFPFEYCLTGCVAKYFPRWVPAFRSNVLPLTAGWTEYGGSMYAPPRRWYLHTRLRSHRKECVITIVWFVINLLQSQL